MYQTNLRTQFVQLLRNLTNLKSNAVKKLVKTVLKNQNVKSESTRIEKRLEEGINPVDIGKKSAPVGSNNVLIKRNEGVTL